MRTTVILDDGLLRDAKRRAAETGRTLSQMIETALREQLRAPAGPPPGRFRMPTFGGDRRVRHEPRDFAKALAREDRAARR